MKGKLRLLTTANSKLKKGEKEGWLSASLQLLPNKLSGTDVCPKAVPQCIRLCNQSSGNAGLYKNRAIYLKRLERTIYTLQYPDAFRYQLKLDLIDARHYAKKKDFSLCVRLNCFSDLDWRPLIADLYQQFPDVVFYDYTKRFELLQDCPKNYHLTFSWSGYNKKECIKALRLGINVAIPYVQPMPETFLGHPVICGDTTDLRFLDPSPVVVGLRFKVPTLLKNGIPVKKLPPKAPFVIGA